MLSHRDNGIELLGKMSMEYGGCGGVLSTRMTEGMSYRAPTKKLFTQKLFRELRVSLVLRTQLRHISTLSR